MTRPIWRRMHEAELKTAERLTAREGGTTVNDLMARLDIKRKPAKKLLEDLVDQGIVKRVKGGHRSLTYEHLTKREQRTQPTVRVPEPQKLDPNAPLVITKDTKFTQCPVRWV